MMHLPTTKQLMEYMDNANGMSINNIKKSLSARLYFVDSADAISGSTTPWMLKGKRITINTVRYPTATAYAGVDS